jgi:uncharacterized protein (DUF58 family)
MALSRTLTRSTTEAWAGPGADGRDSGPGRWATLLWALIYPPRGERVVPTTSGVVLVSLAIGVGTAAYNTANNILFLTLALLLSCLVLSGVLSWMNLQRITWRVRAERALRAGRTTTLGLEVRNGKRLLPTYGLNFEMQAGGERAERVPLALTSRLDPAGGETCLEWQWRPERRGETAIALVRVSSLFPFGFLRKSYPGRMQRRVWVWPATVPYERHGVLAPARRASGETVARVGQSDDLLALRRYAQGDSQRLIHWKASARTGEWLVRQFATEAEQGLSLLIDADRTRWPRPEQCELMISLAATLAEDLFREGRLAWVEIVPDAPRRVRRVADLEAVLDRLARIPDGGETVAPQPKRGGGAEPPERHNRVRFMPEGSRGVGAFLDGQRAAHA